MKIRVGRFTLKWILIFAIIHFLLALYYAYVCLGNDFIMQEHFLEQLMGGIRIEESGNLFWVILFLIPRGLFLVYVTNEYMKDLKTNFLYIFTRTKKREVWLRFAVIKTAISTLCYESLFGIFVIALKVFLWNGMHFSVYKFLLMLFLEFLQVFMLALCSNGLFLFFSETTCVLGTLSELTVPILITGVTYGNHGAWQYPAQWIPLNWGSYNYMKMCHMNPALTVLAIFVLCIAVYAIEIWRINKYEFI